jgi:uncharacterized YkwD family protein
MRHSFSVLLCIVALSLLFPNTSIATSNASEQSTYTLHVFEQEVVKLVNIERQKHNAKPLTIDLKVSKFARDKSEEMRDKDYFDHTSPTYGKPCDRMKREKVIHHDYCSENIAANYETPAEVVEAWMNSAGHRRNILDPMFTHIGVGYAEGPSQTTGKPATYEQYWTQQFYAK